MEKSDFFEKLFLALPTLKGHHARGLEVWDFLSFVVRKEVEKVFSDDTTEEKDFGPFGKLIFPYFEMGAIDSMNLFDLDELIIFSFYLVNRSRYRRVLDLGANIGLHATLLSKCGYEVGSFEPDPVHFERLNKNLSLNQCRNVQTFNKAISTKEGKSEFIRVVDNTTSSHLAGAKANPYGELVRFEVELQPLNPFFEWADLIKMDVEGHEVVVLLETNRDHWANTDAIVEVENEKNAAAIYEHFKKIGVNLFSQKLDWQIVRDVKDVPTGYREGSLFISCKNEMPW